MAVLPPNYLTDLLPPHIDFTFITDTVVAAVLNDYYQEARESLRTHLNLGAVVGAGAVAEGLLTWALGNRAVAELAPHVPSQYRGKPPHAWSLSTLIKVAHAVDLLTVRQVQYCEAIRNWRNLIHPYKRINGSPRFDDALALSAFRAVGHIANAVGGSVEISAFSAAEMKFGWLITDMVAGCRGPANDDDLEFIRQLGIGSIVRVVESQKALVEAADVLRVGLTDLQKDVVDFTAPTIAQLDEIMEFMDSALAQNKRVAVSCGAGYGRTGTVLACYLIHRGQSAAGAFEELARVRPFSAREIDERLDSGQRAAIFAYEEHCRTRH